MDKRIIKTKRNIKKTMISMLSEKSFEEVTVNELCEKAETSRITFYTHYSDKTELANDIIDDMTAFAKSEFYRLQSENNQNGDIVTEYLNLLDCILNTYRENYDFFAHTNESPVLRALTLKFINEYVGGKIEKDRQRLNLRYPFEMVRNLLCDGIRGFVITGRDAGYSNEEVREYSHDILKRLLVNDVLRK